MASSPSRDSQHDDSYSSTSAQRTRRRAGQSTIPLSVAYGAAPDTSITAEHGTAARPRHSLGSPSQAIPSPEQPPVQPSAAQRYADMKRTNQLKEELRRQNQKAGSGPGFITSPPVPTPSGMRDTTVGPATAIINAGGVDALHTAYGGSAGARAGPSKKSRRGVEVPVQPAEEEEEEEEEEDAPEEGEAKNAGRGKSPSPFVDALLAGAARVSYVVRGLSGQPIAEEDESGDSYEREEQYMREGSVDDSPEEVKRRAARRKKKSDTVYKPVEEEDEEDEQEGEEDEEYVPDDLGNATSKKTRRRRTIPKENRTYRPSSEEPYASDEELEATNKRRRKSKAQPPLVLPSHTDPKMGVSHKPRRKSTGKKGKQGQGQEEPDIDEGELTEQPAAPQRARQAARAAPAPVVRSGPTASLSVPAARDGRSLSPAAMPSRSQSPFAQAASRGQSPFAPPSAKPREPSPAYRPPTPPASRIVPNQSHNLSVPQRPDYSHVDSAASVERALDEQTVAGEKEEELEEEVEDIVEPGPPPPGMTILVNIFYTLFIRPIIFFANAASSFFSLLGTVAAHIRASPGSILFWLMLLGGLYMFRYVLMANSPLRTGYWDNEYSPIPYGDSPYVMDPALKEQIASSDKAMLQMKRKADAQAEELARTRDKVDQLVAELAAQRSHSSPQPPVDTRMEEKIRALQDRFSKTERELLERISTNERELSQERDRANSLESSLRSFATAVPALEDKLLASTKSSVGQLHDEFEKTTKILKGHVDEAIGSRRALDKDIQHLLHEFPGTQHTAKQAFDEVQRLQKRQQSTAVHHSSGGQDVYAVLAKHAYDTDLRKDYALFENGARILPRYTSRTFDVHRMSLRFPRLPSLWSGSGAIIGPDPSVVLEKELVPGRCWAFSGNGSIGILLSQRLRMDDIVIGSPPVTTLLVEGATPKAFDVWGFVEGKENEEKFIEYKSLISSKVASPWIDNHEKLLHFGSFEYDTEAQPVQTFPLHQWPTEHRMDFGVLIITFDSNYGADFTCLYRIGVHGEESHVNPYDLRA